ncbi:hypothetical protein ACWEOI_21505 [Nocardia sp. NPDC004340]
MGSALPTKAESLGDKVKVSGIVRNRESTTVTVELYVADGNGGGTGKAELKGLKVGDTSSDWSLVVPSNISPGPFREGGVVIVSTTMRDAAGATMYNETAEFEMDRPKAQAERDAAAVLLARNAAAPAKWDEWRRAVSAEYEKQAGKGLTTADFSKWDDSARDWTLDCYKESGRFPDPAWVAKTYLSTGQWPAG